MDDLFEKEYLAKISANYLKVLQGDGGHCPCCKRFGKYNAFTITQKNAQALVWIYKNGGVDDWANTAKNAPREFMQAKTFTNMRYWGLIEPHPNDNKEKKGSGYWRITQKGINYMNGQMRLPKKAFVYNRKLVGFGEQQIYFSECFKERFNFEEVMNTTFNGATK